MVDPVNPAADPAGGAEPIAQNPDPAPAVNEPAGQFTPPANAGSLLSDEPAEGGEPKSTPAWADDWRDRFASIAKAEERDKISKRLSRFTSPENVFKSYLELEKRVSAGDLKKQLAADATPEQVAEWRKENGIPEKPEDYKFEFKNGFVPSEDDNKLLGDFASVAHERNLPPSVTSELAQWYIERQTQAQQQQYEADVQKRETAADELNKEYGPEYRMNLNAVRNLLDSQFGPELAGSIALARLPDGTPLGSSPDVMRGLVALARQTNPALALMPAGTKDVGASLKDELDGIAKIRREEPHKYWSDSKLLERERELIAAQQRAG